MKKNSRLIVYLLINIVLSASVTLAVLWAWNKFHPLPIGNLESQTSDTDPNADLQHVDGLSNDPQVSTEPSLDFILEDISVSIHIIVGAGDLDVEYVEIHNQSLGAVDLTGWQLKDEQDHIFTFPALILNSNGGIKVLSKAGMNSVIELYWQSDKPIWQSSETANLLNADGEPIASYTIP